MELTSECVGAAHRYRSVPGIWADADRTAPAACGDCPGRNAASSEQNTSVLDTL